MSNYPTWKFDPDRLVLVLRRGGGRWMYEVDLGRCQTSAGVINWIIQVSKKSWASDAVLADLVRQLDDLLNLQATLCSFGQERGPIDVKEVLRGCPIR